MSVTSNAELMSHKAHKIEIAVYGEWDSPSSVTIECVTCNEVLVEPFPDEQGDAGLSGLPDLNANMSHKICNECGDNVAMGSGKFVNRVPDFNDVETRIEMGKPFPCGGYMCAECDNEIRN